MTLAPNSFDYVLQILEQQMNGNNTLLMSEDNLDCLHQPIIYAFDKIRDSTAGDHLIQEGEDTFIVLSKGLKEEVVDVLFDGII